MDLFMFLYLRTYFLFSVISTDFLVFYLEFRSQLSLGWGVGDYNHEHTAPGGAFPTPRCPLLRLEPLLINIASDDLFIM